MKIPGTFAKHLLGAWPGAGDMIAAGTSPAPCKGLTALGSRWMLVNHKETDSSGISERHLEKGPRGMNCPQLAALDDGQEGPPRWATLELKPTGREVVYLLLHEGEGCVSTGPGPGMGRDSQARASVACSRKW